MIDHTETEAQVANLRRTVNDPTLRYYRRLESVRRGVVEDPSRCWTLTRAARLANLSPGYFSFFFSSRVGIPFGQWLAMARVLHALALLREHNLSIEEVAFASGYQSRRTFLRHFRDHVGVTPSAFRKLVRRRLRDHPANGPNCLND